MNLLLATEESRYSITTLKAMYYGAEFLDEELRRVMGVTFNHASGLYTGRVVAVTGATVWVQTGDGNTLDVTPGMILHAEVV